MAQAGGLRAEQGRGRRTIVFELLVEGLDAHRPDALVDQVADRIVDQRGDDRSVHPEGVGHVGRDVELAATDVDVDRRGLAHRQHAGVQPVDQRADAADVEDARPGGQDGGAEVDGHGGGVVGRRGAGGELAGWRAAGGKGWRGPCGWKL